MSNSLISPSDYSFSILSSTNSQGLRPRFIKEDTRISQVYRDLKVCKKDCLDQLPLAMVNRSVHFVVGTVVEGINKGLSFEEGCAPFIDFVDNHYRNILSAKYEKYAQKVPGKLLAQTETKVYKEKMNEFVRSYESGTFRAFNKLSDAEKQKLGFDELRALIAEEKNDPQYLEIPVEDRPQFQCFMRTYVQCFEGQNVMPIIQSNLVVARDFLKLIDEPNSNVTSEEAAERDEERAERLKELNPKIEKRFAGIADRLNQSTVLGADQGLIERILKEQKHHSFSRFEMLPYYYHSFSHMAHAVASFLELQEEGFCEKFIASIRELIQEEMKTDKKVESDYRDQKYMYLEPKDPVEVEQLKSELLRAMRAVPGEKLATKGFVRAHAHLFPGAFSWNTTSIEQVETNNHISTSSNLSSVIVTKDLFLGFKNRLMDQKVFEAQVIDHMGQKSSTLNHSGDLFHYALLWMKDFYLRLFSETELLPDWINEYADKVSEWKFKVYQSSPNSKKKVKLTKTYKLALGELLLNLLDRRKQDDHLSVQDVIDMLNSDYTPHVFTDLQKMIGHYTSSEPSSLVMKSALIQVHQSLLYAFNPADAHEDIFLQD